MWTDHADEQPRQCQLFKKLPAKMCMHIEQHLISQEPYFVGGSYRVPAVPYAFHIKAGLLYCCIHQLLNKLIDWLQATVAHTKQHTITDRQYCIHTVEAKQILI